MKDDAPFAAATTIQVSQSKEPRELFIGIGQRHRFSIDFGAESGPLLAEEEAHNSWRSFLRGRWGNYTLIVHRGDGSPFLRMHVPFAWFNPELVVNDSDDKLLGRVRRRSTWLRTYYEVVDDHDTPLFEIARGFLKMLRFRVLRAEHEVAIIAKRWSGLAREIFSNTNEYRLELADVHDPTHRKLLLGALFLIHIQLSEASASG